MRCFQKGTGLKYLCNVSSSFLRRSTALFSTTLEKRNVNIEVTPKQAMLDDPPRIRVEGLKKNQKVTLWNTFVNDSGLEFSCHAHYIANDKGEVDVRKDASHGGNYKGVFMEGLVGVLRTPPRVYKDKPKLQWARLFKKYVDKPFEYDLRVVDGHLEEKDFSNDLRSQTLANTSFSRHLMADGVRRVEVEDNRLRGILFLPPGKGPFPSIIDLHGAEPGTKEYRAAMLASYGYATMVLPYYKYKDLPKSLEFVNLDYFLEAIEFMNRLPETNEGRVAMVGTSKGAEISLTVSGLTDQIKVCIGINGYSHNIGIDYYLNGELFTDAVKFKAIKENVDLVYEDEKLSTAVKYEKRGFDTPITLPVEKIHDDCEVLLASGSDDKGKTYYCALELYEKALKNGKKKFSLMLMPGAGHLIDPPFHSHVDAIWNSVILVRDASGKNIKGVPHNYGGNAFDNCEASKDLWRRMLALLHRVMVQEAGLPLNTARLYPPYVL